MTTLTSGQARQSPWRWALALLLAALGLLLYLALDAQGKALLMGGTLLAVLLTLLIQMRAVLAALRERLKPTLHWLALYFQPSVTIARSLTLFSLAAMCAAAWLLRPGYYDALDQGLQAFIGGTIALGAAQIFGRSRTSATAQAITSPAQRIRWHALLLGLVALAIVIQANILTPEDQFNFVFRALAQLSIHLQMLLLLSGGVLILWALAGGGWPALRWPRLTWARVALLAILALALAMRLWNLESWVTRWVDEMLFANAVARLILLPEAGPQFVLTQFNPITAFSWFYPYAQALIVSLSEPGLTALRLVSALAGAAQIGAIYLVGRELGGRRLGLLAALLLATFPAHLHFSRIGIANMGDPLFALLAMGLLLRGLRRGSQVDFVLAGGMLALTQYFYEGGRLFFPLFVFLWLGWLALMARLLHDPAWRFPTWRNLLLFVAAYALLTLPLYYTWMARDLPFLPRLEAMADAERRALLEDAALPLLQRLQPYFEKIPVILRGLVQLPDSSWFYGGKLGFVMPWMVPFLLLGIARSLWRLHCRDGSLLSWWLAGVIVGNAVIVDSLSAPRYLVVFPALALLIAVGLSTAWELLRDLLAGGRWRRALARVSGLLLLGGLVGGQAAYYFGLHLPNFYEDRFYNEFDAFGVRYVDTEDALMRAVRLPGMTDVHIVSRSLVWDFNKQTMLDYYGRNDDLTIRHVLPNLFTEGYLRGLTPYRNQAFFLEWQDKEAFDHLVSVFGIAEVRLSTNAIPIDRQMWLYFYPARGLGMLSPDALP